MNIVLITDDFYPQIGGITHTLMNLYEYMQGKEEKLTIFNPFYQNKQVFKVLNDKRFFGKKLNLITNDIFPYLGITSNP